MVRGLLVFFVVVFLAFFAVFSVHASTPLQEEVKLFLESGEELPFFGVAEDAHMFDVYYLLLAARLVTAGLVVGLLAVLARVQVRSLRVAGWLLVVAPLALVLVEWSWLFEVFHHVFFPQGNWRFPAGSLLIQTYPEQFFVRFASWWAGVVVVSGAGLVVASYTRVVRRVLA